MICYYAHQMTGHLWITPRVVSFFEVLPMTNQVDWTNKNKDWRTAAAAKRRERLSAVVRFLARRAAERRWKAMKPAPAAPPPKEGQRP